MEGFNWKKKLHAFDDRRDIIIPGNVQETVQFCVNQFIQIAQESIQERGRFTVALSGGSTPHAIFQALSQSDYAKQVDWSKVFCFWSDERSVPSTHSENNFHTAMEAGLAKLSIPQEQIFRMEAEGDIEEGARKYEQKIIQHVPSGHFDLIMLGMGEDGHTASLFPYTHGLHTKDRLAIANYVPQKNTWRMTLTYQCIHEARFICIYVLGKNKADMVTKVFESSYDPNALPIQRIGTPNHKALWILDREAAEKLKQM